MSETFTFPDLFKKELDLNKTQKVTIRQVVIPKIQRPYAQGRKDDVSSYVRETLLDELFANFNTNGIFDFNFIYGIIRPSNDEYVMELLDGQQRLTTLFLLYWYITNRELVEESDEDKAIREYLRRFVYETRTTATVFCQKLASYHIDITHSTPSASITHAKWYFKSFDRDSTICAMLTMLDAIHARYEAQESRSLFEKLKNVQFYVKSLGYFNLSEELYIKMNARGLQLSPFENFKADLTNFVTKSDFADFQEIVPVYNKEQGGGVPFHFNFSVKLDAKWVDIFWNKGDDNFDAAYMSFFSRFFTCKYIVATKDDISDKEMQRNTVLYQIYTLAENRLDKNEYLGFKLFEEILETHPEFIVTIDKVLDVLHQYDYKNGIGLVRKHCLAPWDKKEGKDQDDFFCNLSSKMSLTKLIVLGAIIEFVDAYDSFDAEDFKKWMRIVWNIVENTNIDGLVPTSALIRKLSALIKFVANRQKEGSDFYDALGKWNTDERENRAVREEVEKARRINEDKSWLTIFEKAEIHPFFKGMVLFFYSPGMTLEDYEHRFTLAAHMFDAEGISKSYREEHLLIRAIVCQYRTWKEINELYVTERAETHKYLKNILAAMKPVQNMLVECLGAENLSGVKAKLQTYIDRALPLVPWDEEENTLERFKLVSDKIHKDVRLYDWMSEEEKRYKASFRIYWFGGTGNVMYALYGKQFAKVALDTDRAKVAAFLHSAYGFKYEDKYQKSMYDNYGDCFGNELWMKQARKDCVVWVKFSSYHRLNIAIDCKSSEVAEQYETLFENSRRDTDSLTIELPALNHLEEKKTIENLCPVIEDVFEKIEDDQGLLEF